MAKRKTRRRFSDEFKAEAVKLVKQSNRSMADLAMELGINAKSIGEWVHRAEENGQSIEEDERSELRRLRKENSELRMEREILKKATVDSTDQRNIICSTRRTGGVAHGPKGATGIVRVTEGGALGEVEERAVV